MVSSTVSLGMPAQRQQSEGVSSTGRAAPAAQVGSVVGEGTAETEVEVDSAAGEVTASTACSPPQENNWSTFSENPQVSTGDNLDTSRPTDDEIVAQENLIRAETADRAALIGEVEPLASLEKEYEAGSQVFVQKIRSLAKSYSSIRRVRGDGNCFMRAFLFGLLEDITQRVDLQERNRLVTCMRQWVPKLKDCGYSELVFEDALEMLIDQLNSLGQNDALTLASLESNMRDDMISNMMVMFIRILVSCELQRRQDFFAPFIMGTVDDDIEVKQFCTRYVEVMGTESDHVHIVALSDALQVPVRVLYLDRSVGALMAGVSAADEGTAVNHHDFVPEAMQNRQPPVVPRVNVLYRPGHYDLVYPLRS